ncbi:hypothetical protein [Chengkuizengella sediminis]|uniref:hypothetical protein n=1 Tax=Chengkuizengella sediminis TaxID=1885917 RepID=UPI00138952F3|nr:hypothetical protein [Chengkuizengella sediminis]NDI35779.1 hypothetical protein [Chengkuizengella sediminis]
MFGYNGIQVDNGPQQAFKDLLEKESIVIAGGVFFYGESKEVFPSCCSGLEGGREILEGVITMKSPWMGHTPYPTFEYVGDNVRVWSDDYISIWEEDLPTEDMYYIEFERIDLIRKIKNLETDLREFVYFPLYNRLQEIDKNLAGVIVENFFSWCDVIKNERHLLSTFYNS